MCIWSYYLCEGKHKRPSPSDKDSQLTAKSEGGHFQFLKFPWRWKNVKVDGDRVFGWGNIRVHLSWKCSSWPCICQVSAVCNKFSFLRPSTWRWGERVLKVMTGILLWPSLTSACQPKQVWLKQEDELARGVQRKNLEMGLLGWLWGPRGRDGNCRKVHFDQETTTKVTTTRGKTSSVVVVKEKPRFWLVRLWIRFLRLRKRDEKETRETHPDQGSSPIVLFNCTFFFWYCEKGET